MDFDAYYAYICPQNETKSSVFLCSLLVDNGDIPVEPAEYSLPCDVTAEFICVDAVDALRKAELWEKQWSAWRLVQRTIAIMWCSIFDTGGRR